MKKVLIFIFFLFIAVTSSYGQDYKANIEKSFSEYFRLMASGEFDKSMEYIPDDFFKVLPKQQMVAMMKQLMNSKEFEFRLTEGKIKTIKDSKVVGGKHYALFNYSNSMSMKFKELDTLQDKDTKAKKLNMIKDALKLKFGDDHVKLNDQTSTFVIDVVKKSCAVSVDGLTNWKFINIETEQKGLLQKILPAEIIDEI